MKERPILFSGPMVRAILDGRKTQTRRVAKVFENRPELETILRRFPNQIGCPYGEPGDRLWVRETWGYTRQCDDINGPGDVIAYAAGGEHVYEDVGGKRRLRLTQRGAVMKPNHFCWPPKPWKPSIYMPRWASRITLEIVGVRVERLQDISDENAEAEGIEAMSNMDIPAWRIYGKDLSVSCTHSPKKAFKELWQSINGTDSWQANPWVWVVQFRRVEQ